MNRAVPNRTPARAVARTRRAAQRGVTMIEVMATTAISAVILGVAAPSFVDSIQVNRARSAAQAMSGLLTEARTEAVKRNVPVLVCPSSDGTACLTTITAASWTGLTIACYDVDGNGACDASTAAAPNPIRVRGAIQDGSVQFTGPTAVVRFNGLGAANDSASFSLSAGSKSGSISVASTGAVRAY